MESFKREKSFSLPLKKTETDILQMNVTNSVLTDNRSLIVTLKKLIALVKTIC